MSAVTASLCSTLLFVGLFVFVSADHPGWIILHCRAPNNNFTLVQWSKAGLEPEHVAVYKGGQFLPDNQHPSFKNRVDLQDRQMKDGDVSLILNNVTSADSGKYECRVFNRGTVCRKRALSKIPPINTIYLRVDPPGQPGGHTEDGSVGLKVGLPVGLIVAAVVVLGVFLIYRKLKAQKQGSYQVPAEQQPV